MSRKESKRVGDPSWQPAPTHPLYLAVATGGAVGYYLDKASEKIRGRASLTYFCGRGRAETTRWMLAATNVEFSNVGLTKPEEMDRLKEQNKLPFGQLPILEIDQQIITQSSSMVLYLAKRANLCGTNVIEEVQCSQIAGAVNDWASAPMQYAFQRDKEDFRTGHCVSHFKKFGQYLERILVDNKCGFMVGKSLTYADVLVAECLTSYEELIPGIIESSGFKMLGILKTVVCTLPGLKKYLKSSLRHKFPDDAYVVNVDTVLRRPLKPWLKGEQHKP